MSVVGAQLTLGTTLGGFEADAAAGFVRIPVTEELPKCLPTLVGGGMELLGNLAGFLFVLQEPHLENIVFCLLGEEGRRVSG